MANTKIADLTALTGANVAVASDELPIVDASASTTKKITVAELAKASGLTPYVDTLVVDKTSGKGLKVDLTTPTFPWADLLGELVIRSAGTNDPAFNTYRGNVRQYDFGNTTMREVYNNFHIPHDYAPGTDIYLHVHWSCAAAASGNVKFSFDVTYAKGHNQAAFAAPITTTVTQAASGTAYQHMISEVQLSASSPSGSQIASGSIEPDGVLLVRTWRDPTDAADTANQSVFVHYVDVHYQSTGIGTKQKAPNFYT